MNELIHSAGSVFPPEPKFQQHGTRLSTAKKQPNVKILNHGQHDGLIQHLTISDEYTFLENRPLHNVHYRIELSKQQEGY